jgi:hypothetical protein
LTAAILSEIVVIFPSSISKTQWQCFKFATHYSSQCKPLTASLNKWQMHTLLYTSRKIGCHCRALPTVRQFTIAVLSFSPPRQQRYMQLQ